MNRRITFDEEIAFVEAIRHVAEEGDPTDLVATWRRMSASIEVAIRRGQVIEAEHQTSARADRLMRRRFVIEWFDTGEG